MYLTVLRSRTSGTVIVCGRGSFAIPVWSSPLLKVVAPPAPNIIRLPRESHLEALDSVLIPKSICSRQLSMYFCSLELPSLSCGFTQDDSW